MTLFDLSVVISAVDQASETIRAVGQNMSVAGALAQGASEQMTGALANAITPAIEFESTMADVGKVVDFPTPEAFAKMGDDILEMSTRIPMAASGLGDIVAAAGQAGIAREELLRFAEDAAKMGVAFDMSGAEAGAAMTGLRSIFKLTQDQVVGLGDATNHLANNMDATAAGLVNIMNRAGSTANLIGLTGEQTAALGATFLALKTPPEVAATGMNALFNKLATADKQGGKFQDALAGIGMSAEELKAALADDAQGALMDFLGAVEQSDDVMGTLTDLFGAEYADDMAKLVGGLDQYRNALGLVGDEAAYAGSMQKEYDARAATTENSLQLMSNILNRLGVTLGNLVLPSLNEGLMVLQDFGNALTDFAKANPMLFKIALGFFAILAVALAIVAPILSVLGGLIMMGSYGMMGVVKLGKGFKWLNGQISPALARLRVFAAGVRRFAARAAGRFWAAIVRMASALWRQLIPALWSGIRRLAVFAASILRFAARAAASFAAGVIRMGVSLLSGMVPALVAATTGAWAFAAALLANPITWIVLAIAAAAALLYVYWEPIVAFFTGLWNDVKAAFNVSWVNGVLKVLELFNPVAWVAKGINALVQYLFGVDLGAAAGAMIDGALAGMSQAWAGVSAWFTGQWQEIVGAFDQGLLQGLAAVFGKISPVAWIAKGFDGLTQYLFGIDLSNAGANIINTIWEGMKSVASKPAEIISDIVGKVRDYLPFSPAKVGPLSDLDRIQLVETIADSLSAEPLMNAMSSVVQAARDALPDSLAVPLEAAWNALPSMDEVGGALSSAWDGITGLFGGAAPAAAPAMAPMPQMAEMPAPGSAAAPGAGAPVSVGFTINIQGDAGPDTVKSLEAWVRENGRLIAQTVERERQRAARTSFAGG